MDAVAAAGDGGAVGAPGGVCDPARTHAETRVTTAASLRRVERCKLGCAPHTIVRGSCHRLEWGWCGWRGVPLHQGVRTG